ncbi:hypothetical protein D3C76_1760070 [compost metagenome]
MMFAQVQDQAVAVHLGIQGQFGLEAVFPVQGETEKVQVELLGFVDAKDAQDRDGGGERDR